MTGLDFVYELNVAFLASHLAVYEGTLVPDDLFGITLASILGLALFKLLDNFVLYISDLYEIPLCLSTFVRFLSGVHRSFLTTFLGKPQLQLQLHSFETACDSLLSLKSNHKESNINSICSRNLPLLRTTHHFPINTTHHLASPNHLVGPSVIRKSQDGLWYLS